MIGGASAMRKPPRTSHRPTRPQPAPLLDWHPPLARQRRARRRPILIAGGIGLALIALTATLDSITRPAPRFLWNASASVPIGLYMVTPVRPIGLGDIMVVRLPEPAAHLADERHYLPRTVPLVKPVAALPGDRVCAIGSTITIDGHAVATRRARDRIGRPLPWWSGCEDLRNGRLFLLAPIADSFDGRYFGPTDEAAIIGRATPLWLR